MAAADTQLPSMQEVAQKAGALGWAGLHVQPLGLSAAAQGARRGQAATDAGQLRQQLLQLLSQNGGTHTQQTPLLMACLQVGLSLTVHRLCILQTRCLSMHLH